MDVPESIAVTFAYFGGDGVEEVTEHVDDAWVDEARSTVEAIVAGASGTEFPTEPSAACHHCDFVRFCPAGKQYLESSS